jgi:acetolactate synthase I/II/III large subunit
LGPSGKWLPPFDKSDFFYTIKSVNNRLTQMPTPFAEKSRTGAWLLVDALKAHGADLAFCVPGESYLAVLDALYDAREQIRLTVCRQEGGAAYMAEAYGKLTGRPGICFVTRGPGASNASIALHTAYQDSTPMILFIGQVGSDFVEREAFQEIDYRRMFGEVAKWVAQVDRADRMTEMISHAFHVATSGRPGPVVLALPEDMLVAEVPETLPARGYKTAQPSPAAEDIAQLLMLLQQAQRPMLLLGGSGWDAAACQAVTRFAERSSLPVATAFRCADLMDNRHPNYIGDLGLGINPRLAQRIKEADVLLTIGARMDEMTTAGYTLVTAPVPQQKLIHVHVDANELGRVYQAELPINASIAQFARAIGNQSVDGTTWQAATTLARREYEEWTAARPNVGPVQISELIKTLAQMVPEDTIVTNGAGNFSGWLHRFYPYTGFRTQLAPRNGSMGYGIPSAVAAKLVEPKRTVVAFTGDGDFLMNGQELATAMQYGANIIIVLFNNGMYGTIRMHQENTYPARVSGTELVNPDFAAYARAFGAHGEVVETTRAFAPALERALQAGRPALIEVRLDPEALSPRGSLSELRAQAMARRTR